MAANAIKAQFAAFVSSEEIDTITTAFAPLAAALPPPAADSKPFYARLRDFISPEVPFIMKRVFQVLDERWNASTDQRAAVLASKNPNFPDRRVAVSGAGPCGLRSAVELAILGFEVTVVERRNRFSRHNILKTWMATVEDLIALGFKNFFPNFAQHGLHAVGTREIQICLLKAALLFGVHFHFLESTAGIVEPTAAFVEEGKGSWRLLTNSIGLKVNVSEEKKEENDEDVKEEKEREKEEEPAELALKVGEQNVDRLDKHSKVDFFERATTKDVPSTFFSISILFN